jgi:putative SOS response-associated peptidase YedK
MPVILVDAQQEAWLASAKAATELLRPAPDQMLANVAGVTTAGLVVTSAI